MLLALHGPSLVDRAIAKGVDLAFEASVGGGIPIIRVLREAFASDWVTSLSGIVNGTCNFILTRMRQDGVSFDEALSDAQARGYAEADPTLDVDGHDAAHKLVVLAMLAFGARVDAARVPTEGIRSIEAVDHKFAGRFGFTIKHLAVGKDLGGRIDLRVHPTLVPREATLANVHGVLNAIAPSRARARSLSPVREGQPSDMPTAVSVVADVLDVARARLERRGGAHDARNPVEGARACPARGRGRSLLSEVPGVRPPRSARADRRKGPWRRGGVDPSSSCRKGEGTRWASPPKIVVLTHHAREKRRPAGARRHSWIPTSWRFLPASLRVEDGLPGPTAAASVRKGVDAILTHSPWVRRHPSSGGAKLFLGKSPYPAGMCELFENTSIPRLWSMRSPFESVSIP